MSYMYIFALGLPIFFGLVYVFYKFAEYKLDEDNSTLSPIFPTDQSIIGLSKEELDKVKAQQQLAQKHLAEAIAKVPVELKDGKFVPMSGEALKQKLAQDAKLEAERKQMQAESQHKPLQVEMPVEVPQPALAKAS